MAQPRDRRCTNNDTTSIKWRGDHRPYGPGRTLATSYAADAQVIIFKLPLDLELFARCFVLSVVQKVPRIVDTAAHWIDGADLTARPLLRLKRAPVLLVELPKKVALIKAFGPVVLIVVRTNKGRLLRIKCVGPNID